MRVRRPSPLALFALLLCGVASAGCPSDRVRGLDADPSAADTLDFGVMPIGSRKVLALPVSNSGGIALLVNAASAGEPFGVDGRPDPVDPGSQGDVLVAFEPSAPGLVQSTLTIETSSLVNPVVRVRRRWQKTGGLVRVDRLAPSAALAPVTGPAPFALAPCPPPSVS